MNYKRQYWRCERKKGRSGREVQIFYQTVWLAGPNELSGPRFLAFWTVWPGPLGSSDGLAHPVGRTIRTIGNAA